MYSYAPAPQTTTTAFVGGQQQQILCCNSTTSNALYSQTNNVNVNNQCPPNLNHNANNYNINNNHYHMANVNNPGSCPPQQSSMTSVNNVLSNIPSFGHCSTLNSMNNMNAMNTVNTMNAMNMNSMSNGVNTMNTMNLNNFATMNSNGYSLLNMPAKSINHPNMNTFQQTDTKYSATNAYQKSISGQTNKGNNANYHQNVIIKNSPKNIAYDNVNANGHSNSHPMDNQNLFNQDVKPQSQLTLIASYAAPLSGMLSLLFLYFMNHCTKQRYVNFSLSLFLSLIFILWIISK